MTRVLLLEAAGPESGALVATAVASGHQVHAATTPDQHADHLLAQIRIEVEPVERPLHDHGASR